MAFAKSALTSFGQLVCVLTLLNGCGSSSASSNSTSPAAAAAGAATTPTQMATTPATPVTPAAPATPAAPLTPPAVPSTATATTPAKPATTPTPVAATPSPVKATPAPVVSNVPVSTTNSGDACLPITMPTADTVFRSSKKIFAHYFYPFPLSIDNKAPNTDYYNTQFLNRNGERGKWSQEGGYLRQRPLGVNASSNPSWKQLNMQHEVTTAIARGISGFTIDIMSLDQATNPSSQLHLMLKAAQAVDSRFKIMVMPDITAFGSDANAVVQVIASVAHSPAAYKLADGRLVVSAFDAGLNSPAWWAAVLNRLKSQGINVAFVPTFLGWTFVADLYKAISYGFGDWGTATVGGSSLLMDDPGIAHSAFNKIFMMPVGPQQFRPKNFQYWEASNSAAFRQGWTSSIQGNTDWVQLVTWNDLSESSQVAPYTDSTLQRTIGTGFYNLSGYYAAWFLTGKQPAITHDVLYYFYRREPSNARVTAQARQDYATGGAAENNIELLAFLTAPGQLKVTIGGKTYTQNAAAGMVSFKVPLQPGVPLFTLSRNGAQVFSFQGGVQAYGVGGIPSGVADMTYWSGSAARSGVCSM
jgi:hypothetical protein